MNLSYEIIVAVMEEQGAIIHQVNLVTDAMMGDPRADQHDKVREAVLCQMINTRDHQVREALIKLGWTPPAEQESK